MKVMVLLISLIFLFMFLTGCDSDTGCSSCNDETCPNKASSQGASGGKFTGAKGEVKILTLDPGHFHAALVQKFMYDQVDPTVHVYAPAGADVEDHLKRIEGFNTRDENPTQWNEVVYTGEDYLEKMIAEKKGNVVVISGNNLKKADYIKACVEAGFNVLADKPMCIDADGYQTLLEAFDIAKKKGVLIYDIMTERSEITSVLQRELVHMPEVFGEQLTGTPGEPAIVNESVHHFFKFVAGSALKRPGWFFDTTQQGEGIVDVTNHLVDLISWGLLPDQAVSYDKDIKLVAAKRWPTVMSKEEYCVVTHLDDFPDYLKGNLDDQGNLLCYANGQINYTIKGINACAKVLWNYKAPEGAKDTHYAIFKGSKADIVIEQGADQDYRPELYVEAKAPDAAWEAALKKAVDDMAKEWSGIALEKQGERWWITVPDKYRVGHEAHFGEVTERFMKYLVDGKLPDWEVPNMKTRYALTTESLKLAKESN